MNFNAKKMLPRTLFGRSLLILVTPILLIQIITTFVFFDSHWGKMTSRLAFAVAGEIAVIASQIEADYSEDNIKEVTGYAGQNLQLLLSYEPSGILEGGDSLVPQMSRGSTIFKTLTQAMESQVRRPYHINVDLEEKRH